MGATRYGQTALGPWLCGASMAGCAHRRLSGRLLRRPLLPEEERHERRRRQLQREGALDRGRGRAVPPVSKTSWLSPRPAGAPEASFSARACLGLPRPISRLGRVNAGWPFRPDFRHSISPPAARRHLLARAQQLVAHLVGVRVVRVRVRARSGLGVGFSSGFGLGPRLGLGSGLAHVSVVHVLEVQREEATARADPRERQPLGTHVVGEHPVVPG